LGSATKLFRVLAIHLCHATEHERIGQDGKSYSIKQRSRRSSGEEVGPAVMALPDDFKLIREIVAAGGSKYTSSNVDRSRYQRLVDLGWLDAFFANVSDVHYQVTERGKAAASRS
jgi:hypothetical protein